MHLADAGDIHQREQFLHFELRTGFFDGFTRGTLCHGFVELHEARRQRPFAKAGFDVALAQQHFVPHTGTVPTTLSGFS